MNRLMPFFNCLVLIFLLSPKPLFSSEPVLQHQLSSHFSKTYKEDLSGLMARRYIRVLTTFNKTNFFLSKGSFFGFEYELLKEYEKFLNKNVNKRELRVVLEFIPVSRDRLTF